MLIHILNNARTGNKLFTVLLFTDPTREVRPRQTREVRPRQTRHLRPGRSDLVRPGRAGGIKQVRPSLTRQFMPGLTRQVKLVPVRHVRFRVTRPDKPGQMGRLQMDRFGLDQLGRSGRSGFVL